MYDPLARKLMLVIGFYVYPGVYISVYLLRALLKLGGELVIEL